jgi:hypothetical protein
LGIAFGKGDPRAPLFVGAVGALLGLVGFFAVSAAHRACKIDASKTNYLAILGALLGAICGGVIGALSVFGRLVISIFNPDCQWRFVVGPISRGGWWELPGVDGERALASD